VRQGQAGRAAAHFSFPFFNFFLKSVTIGDYSFSTVDFSIVSYIALARKWRPKNFSELVGQTHVSQALTNALDQQRLHHAYLFTGTRGVGKTTIARIFAKALNCEQGVSSQPCGTCSVCLAVDEGRFVDLIEVDAASRTKVEDTREILDNVQYAPTQGRYKVYLIDEVHMLSKSSFNALLKTLEEPPEHVKFLLATTDPHKLPVTVLSRCLQFNLMRLTVSQIQQHLAFILQQEQIPFEEAALAMVAKSADGSARDSLSLLDQAIAYGGGKVQAAAVQAMLSWVGQEIVMEVLQLLTQPDPQKVKAFMADMRLRGVNYEQLLLELIEALYEMSRYQVLGQCSTQAQQQLFADLAQQLPPEKVQMCYQMALMARQDLKWVPEQRIGFEMTLLRMVAFELTETEPTQINRNTENANDFSPELPKIPSPAVQTETFNNEKSVISGGETSQAVPKSTHETQVAKTEDLPGRAAMQQLQALKAKTHAATQLNTRSDTEQSQQAVEPNIGVDNVAQPLNSNINQEVVLEGSSQEKHFKSDAAMLQRQAQLESQPAVERSIDSKASHGCEQDLMPLPVAQWMDLIEAAQLEAMALELAKQSFLLKLDIEQHQLWLAVHPQQQMAKTKLAETRLIEGMQAYLRQAYAADFQVVFCEWQPETLVEMTPAQWLQAQQQSQLADAKQAFLQDPFVQQFQQLFDAKVIESSIQVN